MFDCGRTDVRTYEYGRTYGWTDRRTFLPGLLGHLGGDDLKIGYISHICPEAHHGQIFTRLGTAVGVAKNHLQ